LTDASTRKASRYPFSARVVLREPASGVTTSGVTTDISEGGCGVRAQEIFRRGMSVHLELIRNNETIQVASTVAYGLPPNVMGLSFGDLTPDQRSILSRWIEQAVPSLRRSTQPEPPAPDQVIVSSASADSKKSQ